MGACQHHRWEASGEQLAASGGKWLERGGQQGGDIACILIGNGRCCFVVLLMCQLLTDDVCDDVLDVVEGIAGKTVIKLAQEEKRIQGKMWVRQDNVYLRWNRKDVTHWKIRCAKGYCW
jgi:hypothetical protein